MNTSWVIYLVGRVSDWTFWPQNSVNTDGIRLLNLTVSIHQAQGPAMYVNKQGLDSYHNIYKCH